MLQMQGEGFVSEQEGNKKPLVFIAPGLTSTGQDIYIISTVKQAIKEGFEVCIINYRGLNGLKLATPKFYNANSYNDILEPMKYIYNRYCKE